MRDLDRVVAGLTCRDVLAALPDLVDGTLETDRAAALTRHINGCDTCESFGGWYARVVNLVRRAGTEPPEISLDSAARLRRRLADEYRRR